MISFNCVVTVSEWNSCSYKCDQVGKGVTSFGGTITCEDVVQPVSYNTSKFSLCACKDYTDTKIYSDLGLDCSKAACKTACSKVFMGEKKACTLASVTGPAGVAACLAIAHMSYVGCDAACGLCSQP